MMDHKIEIARRIEALAAKERQQGATDTEVVSALMLAAMMIACETYAPAEAAQRLSGAADGFASYIRTKLMN